MLNTKIPKVMSYQPSISKFLYFSFGSNLLKNRIQVKNKSATFICPARLEGYELEFCHHSKLWSGAVANIKQNKKRHVWGAVWEMDLSDKENIDRQESSYSPTEVTVTTAAGEHLTCRTYIMLEKYSSTKNLPSTLYKSVIVNGAQQCGLPDVYIDELKKIKDNGIEKGLEHQNNIQAMYDKTDSD